MTVQPHRRFDLLNGDRVRATEHVPLQVAREVERFAADASRLTELLAEPQRDLTPEQAAERLRAV